MILSEKYREAMDNKAEEAKDDQVEIQKDGKLEDLYRLFQMADFNSDLEKITEILDDRISKLRDQLENARTTTTENFFGDLFTNDYYRNKKRIQDIQEIYDIYWEKVKKEINNANKIKIPN